MTGVGIHPCHLTVYSVDYVYPISDVLNLK